jgi:uncharacterized protein (TIGR00369 family)
MNFMKTIGATLSHMAPGECSISVLSQPNLHQHHGFIHAGVTTTIADTAAGFAALTHFDKDSEVVSAELKMSLLNPAVGDTLVAHARVVKAGRTLSTVQADVYAISKGKDDVHVATGLLTMFQVKPKSVV